MIITKETLKKIKDLIEKRYNSMLISVVGSKVFTKEEIEELKAQGIDTDNSESLLQMVYHNYVLNDLKAQNAPKNISEMRKQQQAKPKGNLYGAAEEHVDESFKQHVDKLKGEVQSSIEGIIRNGNMDYRNKILSNEEFQDIVKDSTVGQVKQKLRDYFGQVGRNYERIAVTEVANALGMGSVDRVLNSNKDKEPEDVLVYRIPVNDSKLCRSCRKFYLDSDQTPAVYRLSTLLANGSNYGKKQQDWKPVALATHPNDRESGVLELRPGWRVGPEGRLEFIGMEKWKEYIKSKLRG